MRAVDDATPDGLNRVSLTPRQRLALFYTLVVPETALQLQDSEITFEMLKRTGVRARNVKAAKLCALGLKSMGATTALELRELDFDALDLTNPKFCSSAVAAFGADEVTQAFLIDAGDAVALAGSVAMHHLNLSTQTLLQACAGSPDHARAVLQQSTPRGAALAGCCAGVLLDTGLRATTLCELGYFLDRIRDQTNASTGDLAKLGFR